VDNKTKKIYQQYILDYLKLHVPNFKITGKGGKDLFTCPLHKDHPNDPQTANIFPENSYNVYCFDPKHRKLGDIFAMVRRLESSMENLDDDAIGKYLEKLFDIKTDERVDNLLAKYHNLGWSLVPVAKGDKKANVEKEWQKKVHKNIQEWRDWLDAGLNIGNNCGLSSVTILDIDAMPSDLKKKWYDGTITVEEREEAIKIRDENLEKVLKVFGNPETLSQKSLGGIHLFFNQEKEIPKTWIEIEGVHVDIETREGQVLLEPSIVKGEGRKMNDKPMISMPTELKELILGKYNVTKVSEEVPLEIDEKIKGLEGECNSTFTKLGGMLRKKLNVAQTAYALQLMNTNLLDSPMDTKDVRRMCRSIEKYHEIDMEDLAEKVVERLEKVEEATIRDLTYSLRQEQKDIEDVIRHLVDTERIYKRGTRYKLFAKANWQTEFVDASKLLEFKVPYFNDYAVCRNGDMIVIGGKTGEGKCITNGYLCTNQGLIDIKEIGEKKPYGTSKVTRHIRLFNGHCKTKTYRTVNYFYKEKVNHTIKITTDYGFEIEGTPEHPIVVIDENNNKSFKQLKDITKKDLAYMVIPDLYAKEDIHKRKLVNSQKSKVGNPKKFDPNSPIDENMAKLFGYIIGDGSLSKNCVQIFQDSSYPKVVKEICDLIKSIKMDYSIYDRPNHKIIAIHSVHFAKFVRICLFETKKTNKLSSNRNIPKRILRASKQIQSNFIAGLFNAESSINMHKFSGNLEITMANKKLIDVLQLLLLNMGILSKKTLKKVKAYPENTYYRLSFTSEMSEKLLNIIKPIKYYGLVFDQNFHVYKKMKYVGNNQHKQNSYFKDKIVKIEHNYNEIDVYDFNIESPKYKINNQFWSNGFISHNTHIALNMVKEFKEQGLVTNYISSEPGNRFAKIAMTLGLKEGDLKWCNHYRPEQVELEDNTVTIIDWLLPENYAETDKLYSRFAQQLDKHGGLLIIFTQLRKDGTFFAKDMVDFFASVNCTYNQTSYSDKGGKITYDSENTYFFTSKIRESRTGRQIIKIPTVYDKTSKILELRNE